MSCEGRTGCYGKENNKECENQIGDQEGMRSDMNLGVQETRPSGKSLGVLGIGKGKDIKCREIKFCCSS